MVLLSKYAIFKVYAKNASCEDSSGITSANGPKISRRATYVSAYERYTPIIGL